MANDQVNDSVRRSDEEPVEIFAQLFHLIPSGNAVDFQKRRGRVSVISLKLQPDIGMTEIRNFVDPQPVRTKLEDATIRLFLDQWQGEGIALKSDRLVIAVSRTLDGDVCAARELWTVNVSNHCAESE